MIDFFFSLVISILLLLLLFEKSQITYIFLKKGKDNMQGMKMFKQNFNNGKKKNFENCQPFPFIHSSSYLDKEILFQRQKNKIVKKILLLKLKLKIVVSFKFQKISCCCFGSTNNKGPSLCFKMHKTSFFSFLFLSFSIIQNHSYVNISYFVVYTMCVCV